MNKSCFAFLLPAAGLGLLAACSAPSSHGPKAGPPSAALRALEDVKAKYAPDAHLAIFEAGLQRRGAGLVLTGEVDQAQAAIDAFQAVQRAGAQAANDIRVLPARILGDRVWGVTCLSVASGRLQPEHKAEMGTQLLMGELLRVWKPSTNAAFPWFLVQSADGYLSWIEKGGFVRRTREEAEAWNTAPRLIVTAFEDCVLELPQPGAQPVSDVVTCNLLKKTGEQGDWFQVELPDGRAGFLPKAAAQDYAAWKASRRPTPENIERASRTFLGRPYLWGGASPKGFDCSGFTKLVFWLNGIALQRDAGEQARQGQPVPLTADLSQLRKGDLIFFGRRAQPGRAERITHVGIYLDAKLFIHSSERVRINSLDPDSPLRDEHRIRTLLRARRVLPDS